MNFYPAVITSCFSWLTSEDWKKGSLPYSNYLDLNSVYGGGGSSGIPVDVPCVPGVCVIWAAFGELSVSRLNSDILRNSCLFLHSCWLAAKPSLSAGFGGGSEILVMRYAVDASAIP
jgi:hypothetical protein